MSSTRLPGKISMDIDGKSMLERVVNRLKRAKLIDDIVIATTINREDDKTVELASKIEVAIYRGSEEDVLDRYYQAAKENGAEHIVRITADCPLIDPDIVDRVMEKHLSTEADYTANIIKRTFSRGFDVEVFKFDALEIVREKSDNQYDREHVTPYFRDHPELFKIENILANDDEGRPELRLCVDENEDLTLIKKIYENIENIDRATASEIVKFIADNPQLKKINLKTKQKST